MHIKTAPREYQRLPKANPATQRVVSVKDHFEPVPRTTTITQKPLSLRELIGNPKELKLPEHESSEEFLGQIYAQRDQLRTLPRPELLQLRNRLEKLSMELPESEQTFFEKWFYPGADYRARMHSLLKRCIRVVHETTKNYPAILADGSKYVGNWKEDKPDGYGICTDAYGSRYEGNWKEGKRDGPGIFTEAYVGRYEGNWKENKWDGPGISTSTNGARYEGNWKEGKRDGYGIGIDIDGNKYEGHWKEGKQEGYGISTYTGGSKYEGNWKEGKWDGHGVCTSTDGTRYEGNWKEGKLDGHGVCTSTNGTRYEGNWKEGKWDGQCVFTHASGVTISGKWSNNFFIKPSSENMGNPIFIGELIGSPVFSGGPIGFASTVLESYALELAKKTTEKAEKTWLTQSSSLMHQANQRNISAPQPEELLNQIRNLPEKGSLTLNYRSVGHAMVLQISKHENELQFSIYNSGEGLIEFHESKKFDLKTKYKTVKTFRIPLKEADVELATRILMSSQKSTPDAYALFSSKALPDVSSQSDLDSSKNLTELWQSNQKSGNCQLECWMAWLKNTAPSLHAYTRFRKQFFELALEKSKQDPEMQRLSREKPELANAMHIELERKIRKRETK